MQNKKKRLNGLKSQVKEGEKSLKTQTSIKAFKY